MGRVNLFVTVKFFGPLVNVVPDDTVTSPSIIISPDVVPCLAPAEPSRLNLVSVNPSKVVKVDTPTALHQ